MSLRRPALLALALTVLAPLAVAQDAAERIDDFVTASHAYGLFNGTVLVAEAGEVVYAKGVGEADKSWGTPNTTETKFRIGSLTKQFTAALVLQLVEAGQIDLDAPISTYLPDYPVAQGDRVTVHHLLSHTSGVPEHTNQPDMNEVMRRAYAPGDFLALFSDRPLDFEPGSRFSYSNSGYYLLGVIVERVTGQTYGAALRERLLAPLGLGDTGYDPFPEILPSMARGYTRTALGFENAPYIDTSVPYAAGMMVSTAPDLFRWTQALHRAEPFRSAATLDRMLTPALDDYGYGIGVSTLPIGGQEVRAVAHSGGIPGFSTMLIHLPERDQTIVVLDNTQGSAGALARSLALLLYDQPVALPKQPVGLAMAQRIEAEGVDAAVAFYQDVRAGGDEGFETGEDQLNGLGYTYLERGDVATAVRLFRLNVEAYPEAWNPHDSLGEALLAAGDTARAVASYQRSLALNPANENGRDVLAGLGVDATAEAVEPSEAVLERYVGEYAVQPSFVISVTREGTQLYGQATGQPRFELFPSSETRFYLTAVEAQVSFTVKGDGPATRLTLHQGGRDTPAARVED